MKILHVMNWYIPGMTYQENYLPFEQRKLGHQVDILASDRHPAYISYGKSTTDFHGERIIGSGVSHENGVRIFRAPAILEATSSDMLLLKGLKHILEESEPDVVHAHGALVPSTVECVWRSRMYGYKLFIDDHSHEDNFHADTVSKRFYLGAMRRFYTIFRSRIACWMPVTYSARSVLMNQLNVRANDIEMLHLGADSQRFHPSPELRKKGRQEMGLDSEDILIVSTGKFDESKDIHVLMQSLADVRKEHLNVRLLLIGGGAEDYMMRLRALANEDSRLKSRVAFKGFVTNTELPMYYNAADIGVWPGNHSIGAIEAMATGLPLVIPAGNQAYGIVYENDAAASFKRRDSGSLAATISSLVSDSSYRLRLSRRGVGLVQDSLSWKNLAKRSLQIYDSRYPPPTP